MNQNKPARKDGKRRAAATGADIVAGTAGTAAGLGGSVLLGPPGALLGPAVSSGVRSLLRKVGADRVFIDAREAWIDRELSEAERVRLNTTWNAFISKLASRLEVGEKIRNDGFFDGQRDEDGRSGAADLLEGVLIKARDCYEQRKAERLGELLSFVVTRPHITPGHAHYLLTLAGRLTYQQLLFLGALAEQRQGTPDWTTTGAMTEREVGTVTVLLELGREELLVRSDHRPVQTFTDVNPSQLRTALNGTILVEAMSLTEAEEEDWLEVTDALRRLGTIDVDAGTQSVQVVVPRGSEPDVRRVQINHRTMRFPPMAIGLEDVAQLAADDESPPEK